MKRGDWKTDQVLKRVYRNTISPETKKFNDKLNEHFSSMQNVLQTEIEKSP